MAKSFCWQKLTSLSPLSVITPTPCRPIDLSLSRVERLIQKGHSLKSDVFPEQSFENVKLVLHCDGNGSECKHFLKTARNQFETLGNIATRGTGSKLEPTVSVCHTQCYRKHPRGHAERMFSELVLLTDGTSTTINDFKKAHTNRKIIVSSPDDIKRSINLLLEQYVCSVLRQMVANATNDQTEIDKVRRTKHMPEQSHSQLVLRKTATTRNMFGDHERNGLLSIKRNGLLSIKRNGLLSIKRNASELESGLTGGGKRFKPSPMAEEDRHHMEILLLDVKALFERSDVPASEWPRFENSKT